MIEIKNMSFAYDKRDVYTGIDLCFAEGGIYGLLGENGVGKTTLLKLVSGLLCPREGSVTVDGLTAFDRLPSMLRRLFFLPDTVELPERATPQLYANEIAPFYPSFSQTVLEETLREFEVRPEWPFVQMSYGQQKKAMIAVAIAMGTDYLLFDEPTNGLDIPSKAQFRSIMSHRKGGRQTTIISTHQVRDMENLIDPIVILKHNEVLLHATMQQISAKLYFEYGGQPRDDAYYSEQTPQGCLNVVRNTTGADSAVNIEALFNAVHVRPQEIKWLMQSTGGEQVRVEL